MIYHDDEWGKPEFDGIKLFANSSKYTNDQPRSIENLFVFLVQKGDFVLI